MPFVRPIATAGAPFNTALVDQSAWFDGSADYLSWTPGSAANSLKVWGFEAWVLRTGFSGSQYIFSAGPDSSNDEGIYFLSTGEIGYFLLTSGVNRGQVNTDALFRDVGWYHISVQKDATANSITIRVNGEVQTLTTSVSIADVDGLFGKQSTAHKIGALNHSTANFFNGYLAQATFTDNQNNAASDVGETYTLGTNGSTWVPKADSAIVALANAAGGNSFCLTSAIGDGTDASTNGNDFTPTSMSHAANGSSNTPSLQYPIFNVLDYVNLTNTTGEGGKFLNVVGNDSLMATTQTVIESGIYWEMEVDVAGDEMFGLWVNSTKPLRSYSGSSPHTDAASCVIRVAANTVYNEGSGSSFTPATISNGDILMFAYKNGQFFYGKNGSWENSGDPTAETGELFTIADSASKAIQFVAGQSGAGSPDYRLIIEEGDLNYSIPSGYTAWNTANLPTPEYQGADWFNALTYTGDATNNRSITGVGFASDFLWHKKRSGALSHKLQDLLRGVGNVLYSDVTNAEQAETGFDSINDADGYTIDNANNANDSGATYVTWHWLANGSGVSNTDGSITSTVSVAEPGHFAIVSWTGNGTNSTVGHGLPGGAECIIAKNRDNAYSWGVWHKGLSSTSNILLLNSTAAQSTAADYFANGGSPDGATTFGVGTNVTANENTSDIIAYLFRSVPGISLVSDYTGNGSTDGPYVQCGFKPRWIMSRRTDSTGSWQLKDTARDLFNPVGQLLQANASAAEVTFNAIDILGDGFKVRTTNADYNASGGTYIFIAIADVAGGGDLPPIPGR